MKRILLFCLITILGASCAKKVVAPFAPSASNSQPAKHELTESDRLHVMNELAPSNHFPQQSVEASQPAVAAPVAPKAVHETASYHVDRVLNEGAVQKKYISKASFKTVKAPVSGPRNWAPPLKIGITLLGIGVILAVFGLGLIGGLAALIGLGFTILGLLVTY